MKTIAKWVVIIWSLLSLCGICYGLFNISQSFTDLQSDFEFLGGTIGLACGLGIWIIIWFAVAGPALLIYFVSGKKETTKVEIIESPTEKRSN